MGIWIAVLSVAFGTYLMRASLILLLGRVVVPPRVERTFRYITPAVLAAILVPAFVTTPGPSAMLAPSLVAAGIGTAVAWRYRNIPVVLVAGLAAYHATTWLLAA